MRVEGKRLRGEEEEGDERRKRRKRREEEVLGVGGAGGKHQMGAGCAESWLVRAW